MQLLNLARKSFLFLIELFFPSRCVGCGKAGSNLCIDCVSQIEKFKTDLCPSCGRLSTNCAICPSCKRKGFKYLNGIFVGAAFEAGPTKEMIHHLKYTGIKELSEILGELMLERIQNFAKKNTLVVVPVPLHKKREAARGFNQAELIGRYVAKRIGCTGGNVLERVKNTASQVTLGGDERRKNLQGAFECTDTDLVEGRIVLLVDDVATTGSTLEECAKVLKEAGAKKVYGLVAARRSKH